MNILKFKELSSVFGVAILLTVAILMFMSMIATVNAASVANVKVMEDNGKIGVQKSTVADQQGEVEKKFKKVKKYTLTFNPNGGKVKTKTKKLNYKQNYGTLQKPTRSGYTFEGWFTAKKGGKKVSKTTKMPAKNTVVYAQWKKNTNTNANSKLVGRWDSLFIGYTPRTVCYYFLENGNFKYFDLLYKDIFEGKYSVSNGKVYFKEVKRYPGSSNDLEKNAYKFGDDYLKYKFDREPVQWEDMITEYQFGSDKEGNYLQITEPKNSVSPNYYTLSSASKFRKVS